MTRAQTLLALAAVVLASMAALQLPGRLFFALAAVLLIGVVAAGRLRAGLRARRTPPRDTLDAGTRAAEIRAARERRLRR